MISKEREGATITSEIDHILCSVGVEMLDAGIIHDLNNFSDC